MRIGTGYDVHRLVEGRKLIIGGVEIPHTLGLLGHSDADVLLHAIMDALLGAAALGDIGKHFPDTDEAYQGHFLSEASGGSGQTSGGTSLRGWGISTPPSSPRNRKLRPYIGQMEQNVADVLGIAREQVNIKATTEEHLGFTGREEGISAQAVCLLESFYDGSAVAADSEEGCAGCGGCPKTGGGY